VATPVTVYDSDAPGVKPPTVVTMVRPQYTREKLDAKIWGNVALTCVVDVDGKVGDVTIVQSLDPVLDQQAIIAARQWRFTPGTKDGKAVPVRVTLELTFSIR
jgi:protein TonB